MLEIILLVFLWRALGERLRKKGRTPIGYQLGLVALWFGSEFCAGVIYGLIAMMNGQQEPEFGIGIYLLALLSAAASAVFMFTIVHFLSDLNEAPRQNSSFGNPSSDNPYARR